MKASYLLLLVLALALIGVSLKLLTGGNNATGDNANSAIDNILTRVSVRAYQDKPVAAETIDTLLRAGMAAPTAVNKQPWHFIVVTDKATLEQISTLTPNARMAADAPLAIVVCGDLTKALERDARDYWVQDASAAVENILLAAHAMGLGAVWTGIYPIQDRCTTISGLFKLPDTMIPLATIVIGYPAETPAIKDKYKPENISYNTYGNHNANSTTTVAAAAPAAAPAEAKLKPIDVKHDFRANPFAYFNQEGGMLLAAGDRHKSNAMTIGWGSLGNLWGHDRSIVTVYVAEKRYTHSFMEQTKYFTIMEFAHDEKGQEVLKYMGTHSGRDGDKAAALGLHTAYTDNGTPYYEEATSVIECRLLYKAPFDPAGFTDDVPRKFYDGFDAGYHSTYIGEVVAAWHK